mmetsp:Transcript_20637/g.19625  ORF Transcript_20637/g.19625 Transcript_20637/m.19625 type:complete len:160 (+) Transcript_20637:336-815(+)
MKGEERIKAKTNKGVVFMTLGSPDRIQEVLMRQREIKKELLQTCPSNCKFLDVSNWNLEPAPCPSDIMWENLNKKNIVKYIQVLILNIFLFVCTVMLVTPLTIVDKLGPLITDMEDEQGLLASSIAGAITPLIIYIFNWIFIPNFVNCISYYEEHETKS